MNKFKFILASIVVALILGGCSNDKKENATPSTTPASTQESKTADYWTVIDGATWSDDYEGLKTTVKKIVVSNEVPLDGNKKPAVGVSFTIENTTKDTFTTYPDQAVLVTSTGEQVEADMHQSEIIGGEIYEGVTKKGGVIFFLKEGHVEDIKWITLKWLTHKGGSSDITRDNQKNYDVKIEF
ncbi:hypothetical protein MKY96_33485 [Paenibacillus sp. FSL R7-0302]|uniref:hypothetical protein n=1 Tax=Paenibacillus sp. FSL R7-0302 TaxID=2921681 RepID=UPI0030F63433